jgi:uncharacterized protein
MPVSLSVAPRAFHIMTKPIGPICNLGCQYCFYLEKQKLYPGKSKWRMSDETLEAYVRQYIQSQDVPEVAFAWQGGEPTLMGLDFFRRAVELQQKYADGKRISNAIQTNGTLLNQEWCEFFRDNHFLVGLSIDGPRHCHDHYRVDKKGRPTFDAVYAGMMSMKKYGVDFNALCVVNRYNSKYPLEVYKFLKTEGSGFIQFIPLVERVGADVQGLAGPPQLGDGRPADGVAAGAMVAPWSVEPLAYGEFLCAIFDRWIKRDVGKTFVQIFDVQLGVWLGMPASLCVFAETCGNALALEHNGDLYACDHYVYDRYRLGNILSQDLGDMVASPQQRKFGTDKLGSLPRYCRECEVKSGCNGECPKHRFLKTPDGEAGLNYLCAGYKKFLHHIDGPMTAMAELLKAGRPAAEIMGGKGRSDEATERQMGGAAPGRNDPCPCGSGKKYKRCCGAG